MAAKPAVITKIHIIPTESRHYHFMPKDTYSDKKRPAKAERLIIYVESYVEREREAIIT